MAAFPVRFGAYVLVDHLGRGGMGNVFLAVKGFKGLETVCVLKRLLPELVADRRQMQRFHDEAGLARRFAHPNLVSTFDVGMVGSELYLAQEHVHGRDLTEVMGQCWEMRAPLSVGLAVHIIRELAGALEYVHTFEGLNIVHRDINPPNIRVAYTGAVKLLDFGVAKSDIRLAPTTENEALGKPFFMAPEQLFDEEVDRRADVYVLGLVLWELLTLRPVGTKKRGNEVLAPQEGRAQMLERVRASKYERPSLFNDLVPTKLDEVVLRCLARDPNVRYQSADELAVALRPFVAEDEPGKDLKAFMAKLFDVNDAATALKRRIAEGSALLPMRPEGSQASGSTSDEEKVYADRRRRGVRPALIVAAAACVLAAIYAIVEITKAVATKKDVVPPVVMENRQPPSAQLTHVAQEVLALPDASPVEVPPYQKRTDLRKTTSKTPSQSSERIAMLIDEAMEAFAAGKPLVANTILDDALAAGAGAQALILKAKVFVRLGRYEEAEEQIQKALATRPNDKEAMQLRNIIEERRR